MAPTPLHPAAFASALFSAHCKSSSALLKAGSEAARIYASVKSPADLPEAHERAAGAFAELPHALLEIASACWAPLLDRAAPRA